jgi:hypothetical protein
MTAYWGIRTSKERHDLISEHLESGVLRQGWGAQDLREIGQLVKSDRADDAQRSIWRYTQKMLDIEPGDIVLTPHQLTWHKNGVWRVTGGYEFDPLPNIWGSDPDFGHVVRVEPIGVIDHHSAAASSDFRRAMTAGFRPRMRQLNAFSDEIDRLLADPSAATASDAAEHFAQVRAGAREALGVSLGKQYKDADFEKPIRALLEVLYPNAVRHTSGPAEQGRDFVIEEVDALGLSRNVIVQVKAWSGEVDEHSLDHGLEQLARGIEAQGGNVDLAVLLTLADDLPVDADKRIAIAEERTSVPMRVLMKEDVLDLLLDHLAQMEL